MKLLLRVITWLSCLLLLFFIYLQFTTIRYEYQEDGVVQREVTSRRHRKLESVKVPVTVAVVACGDRLQETLVVVKSAIFFSDNVSLRIIIVSQSDLIPAFQEKLSEWRGLVNNSFTFDVKSISFPPGDEGETWRRLFKPCASQRLFFPSLLSDVDSVLYVDTDVIFLSPLESMWNHFNKFNVSQLVALSPEHEDPNQGWYNRFARHPYYGSQGVNSGVMLMNLTRMRDFQWESYLGPILREYKTSITWGDQDIINIIFHYHPGRLYVWDCSYNYRSDHCVYSSVCSAAKDGVHVVHGSRAVFHSEKQPAFSSIYTAFQKFQIGGDPFDDLLSPLESSLQQTQSTNCGKNYDIFIKNMKSYLEANIPD